MKINLVEYSNTYSKDVYIKVAALLCVYILGIRLGERVI